MTLRHYTDEDGRSGIEASGVIRRGPDGRVFLTRDVYSSGREAQLSLALARRPTGFFDVPEDRLVGLSEERVVSAHHGQPGGGREAFVEHPVDASGLRWEAMEP